MWTCLPRAWEFFFGPALRLSGQRWLGGQGACCGRALFPHWQAAWMRAQSQKRRDLYRRISLFIRSLGGLTLCPLHPPQRTAHTCHHEGWSGLQVPLATAPHRRMRAELRTAGAGISRARAQRPWRSSGSTAPPPASQTTSWEVSQLTS